jgi:hypothetical protein
VTKRYLAPVNRRFGAALATCALVVTSACGGGSSRPSADELSKALRKGGQDSVLGADAGKVSKKGADCIARVLVDSRISDRALQAILDANASYLPSKADAAAAAGLRAKIVNCLPAGLS